MMLSSALGNGSYKKVCGFCTFAHTMWKGTKLYREFTSAVVLSYKKIFVTFYHLITNNRFVTTHIHPLLALSVALSIAPWSTARTFHCSFYCSRHPSLLLLLFDPPLAIHRFSYCSKWYYIKCRQCDVPNVHYFHYSKKFMVNSWMKRRIKRRSTEVFHDWTNDWLINSDIDMQYRYDR